MQPGRFHISCGFFLRPSYCVFRRLPGLRCADMLHDALCFSGIVFWKSTGRGKLCRRVLRCLFRLFGKIRFLFPAADTLGGFFGFVYLNKSVTAHFLRDFITGLQWVFHAVSPPFISRGRIMRPRLPPALLSLHGKARYLSGSGQQMAAPHSHRKSIPRPLRSG